MRKTRLVILPTKCLNQMGFLLLFLSCPVIGDWGRIRPDSEMSQWSILIEREGSCGLVRNPINVKNSVSEKLKECLAYNGKFMNGTLPTHMLMKNSIISSQIRTDPAVLTSETPLRRATSERRIINSARIRVVGKRLRTESEERPVKREMRSPSVKGERREALERRVIQAGNANRNVGGLNRSVSPQRLLRRTYQEKSYRSVHTRHSENQTDRLSVQTRESKIQEKNQNRSYLFNRRVTSPLREREGNERREKNNFERTLRRIENVRSRRSTNEMKTRELLARSERQQPSEVKWARLFVGNDRRVDDIESRKLTRYNARELKNDETVRINNQQRISRRLASNNERTYMMERRFFEEEKRIQNDERRLNNMRRSTVRDRQLVQNRRNENSNERTMYTNRNTETIEIRDARAKSRIETPNSARQRRSISRTYSQSNQRMNQLETVNRRELENIRNNRERNDRITRIAVKENDQVSRRRIANRRQIINKEGIRENDSLIRIERSIDSRQMSERRNDLVHAQRTESNHSRKIREERATAMRTLTEEKTRESRDTEKYLERTADQRERMRKMEMLQYDQLETLAPKIEVKMNKAEAPEQWEFLDSTKNWIGLKNYQESRVIDYKDFMTTCLLGTAVFFLTTRPIKSI